MKRSHFLFLASWLFLISINSVVAQPNKTSFYGAYTFSSDSLKGFEETAAKNSAISEGFLGNEFNVRMFQLKRAFINSKYKLSTSHNNGYIFQNKTTLLPSNCVNEDFESSLSSPITSSNQIAGWTVDAGLNQLPGNSCNLLGCCPNAPSESALLNCAAIGGYIDPIIGGVYPIYSVFGTTPNSGNSVNPSNPPMFGTNVIRINNAVNDFSIERLSKVITVTPANALFEFAFISVFFTSHACCDAGAIQIKFTNLSTNSLIACPNFSLAAPGPQCTNSTSINYFNAPSGTPFTGVGTTIYNQWNVNSIDLTPYLGSSILIEVIATDCTAGGHYGYAYFDSKCSAQTFTINGVNNGGGYFTLCNPIFSYYPADSYLWNGPAGSGITNVTTSTINVTVSGVYTLATTNNGCTTVNTQTLNITLTPPPSVTLASTSTLICQGGSVLLTSTVTGATSYTWSTGSTNPSIIVSPTATTVYTVTADYFGSCPGTSTIAVNVSNCTRLNENLIRSENIVIYPNPIKDNVTVNAMDVLLQEIKITNTIGQVIYTRLFDNSETATIDCAKFSTGVYFIELKTNKGSLAKKIIKE